MAKKGSDTSFNAISAELARVDTRVSDIDAALSRHASNVEALSSRQDAAAAAIAGIQASTASAQTAQAIEVMVLAVKVDAVTDEIKSFQASTGTALAVLSDGATTTSITMVENQDARKLDVAKGAEALDALLAQFMTLKEVMAIDLANMVARMAKCEDTTKASDERWVEENVRMRAQVQEELDTMKATATENSERIFARFLERGDYDERESKEPQLPFFVLRQSYVESETANAIDSKTTQADKAKLDLNFSNKITSTDMGLPVMNELVRYVQSVREFVDSSDRVFGGSQRLPHVSTLTSRFEPGVIKKMQIMVAMDDSEASTTPRTSATLMELVHAYIDMNGGTITEALRKLPKYSFVGSQENKYGPVANKIIMASARMLFEKMKELLDSCALHERGRSTTKPKVVMAVLNALPNPVAAAVRTEAGIQGEFSLPPGMTYASLRATVLTVITATITTDVDPSGNSTFQKHVRDALLGLENEGGGGTAGNLGGGGAAAHTARRTAAEAAAVIQQTALRRAAGIAAQTAAAAAARKPAVAAGGAGNMAANIAAAAAAAGGQRGTAADAAAFAAARGKSNHNVNISFTGKCFTCQQSGHRVADCPMKK